MFFVSYVSGFEEPFLSLCYKLDLSQRSWESELYLMDLGCLPKRKLQFCFFSTVCPEADGWVLS